MVLRLVNSSERKKPPTISTPTIHANDTPGVKVAQAATNAALISAFTTSTRRNPYRRRMIGITVFMPMAPTTFDSVISPDWKAVRSEEHTSELQSQFHLVCRLLLEKKKFAGRGVDASQLDLNSQRCLIGLKGVGRFPGLTQQQAYIAVGFRQIAFFFF